MKTILLLCWLALTSAMSESCLEYNTDYFGTNINNGLEQRTDSAEDCQKLCQATTGCKGFTWASANFPGTKNSKKI